MRRMIAVLSAATVAVAIMLAMALPAFASDHLFNAAHSQGVDARGFANPVVGNPSGTSGAAAQPTTVPGEGNPNAGADKGTPAADLDAVFTRSGGHANP